jgi:hypothetical protein
MFLKIKLVSNFKFPPTVIAGKNKTGFIFDGLVRFAVRKPGCCFDIFTSLFLKKQNTSKENSLTKKIILTNDATWLWLPFSTSRFRNTNTIKKKLLKCSNITF